MLSSIASALASKGGLMAYRQSVAPILYNFKSIRTILSDKYYCYDNWDKYMQSSTLTNMGNTHSLTVELSNKLTNGQLVTPLDVELLTAKLVAIENFRQLGEFEEFYLNFRKTQPSFYMPDSFHYLLIRNYIDINQADRLVQFLKLKYKYGIFVDSFSANLLIDHFLKENKLRKAALVAHEVMLQEDSTNELTMAICLYSCLRDIKENSALKEEKTPPAAKKETPTEGEGENGEPIKKWVYFKRNDYDDEHFDLKSLPRLNGKTILFAAKNAKSADAVLVNSLQIYGLLLFEKYEEALKQFKQTFGAKTNLHHFVVEEFQKVSEKLSSDKNAAKDHKHFLDTWKELYAQTQTKEESHLILSAKIDIVKEVESYLNEVRSRLEDKDMSKQTSLFAEWESNQKADIQRQVKNFVADAMKEDMMRRLASLERQEEVITFFDKRPKIIKAYAFKGFPKEFVSRIPVEPQETLYRKMYLRHFKPYALHLNRPRLIITQRLNWKLAQNALNKIYVNNKKATGQTMGVVNRYNTSKDSTKQKKMTA